MSRQWLSGIACVAALVFGAGATAAPGELATSPVTAMGAADVAGYDGVVEAVRQTVVAAQVAGTVVAVDVKVGDFVKAGQALVKLDASAAQQSVAAGDAQVQSARASLEVAAKEYERQKQLYNKKYISQGALERAEAQYKAAQAQVDAQTAQVGVARTQSGFFVARAPYAGVVAEVSVVQGDMAMPGRSLVTLYDPAALRVTVAVPQSVVAGLSAKAAIRVEIPGLPADRQSLTPTRVEVLPTVDAATHTAQLRLDLPAGIDGVRPGAFARTWLPGQRTGATRLAVPARAIVRRAEMTGVYVIDPNGRPVLRQVRLGRASNDSVEILAGLSVGERVVLDPQAAVRTH